MCCRIHIRGLVEAFREIVPALIRQSRDANYFVLRELPAQVGEPAPVAAVGGETSYV
jgi:hypothetical protein